MHHYFQTEHLEARLIDESFAPQLVDFFKNNRAFLQPFEPIRPDDFYTLEGQQRECYRLAQQNSTGNALSFALSLHEEKIVIGTAALNGILHRALKRCYLSCRIDQSQQRHGLATEVLKSLIAIAFEVVQLHRIEAQVMPRNAPSVRVVQKLGFFLKVWLKVRCSSMDSGKTCCALRY